MNYVEIREDYDEKEEAALNEITDKTSKIHIDMNKESKMKKEFSAEDEAIFEMLKQAELEEEMENAKNKENEYEEFIKSLKEYDENNEEDIKGKKKEDSDSDSEDNEDKENNYNVNFEHLKEKFNLYKQKEIQKMKEEEKENKIFENIKNKSDNDDNNADNNEFTDMSQIKNPADIYRHIYNINEQAKKNKLRLENEKKENELSNKNSTTQDIQENKTSPLNSSSSNNNNPKKNSYISNIKPKQPKNKKSSLFKSHMMEQRKKHGIIEKNIVESNPVISKDVINSDKDFIKPSTKQQVITAGVKSIVQEHNVNNNYRESTPKKKGKVSLFKKMAEAQHNIEDSNIDNNSDKKLKNVPVMQNVIKENPNNIAMDEDDIDFYFTQREANQEYQKRKYQKTLIAKEKPLDEYNNENDE